LDSDIVVGFVRAGFVAGGERLGSAFVEWEAFGKWSVEDDTSVIRPCGLAYSDAPEFIHLVFVLFSAKDRMGDAV
jgi:hypothetical protein